MTARKLSLSLGDVTTYKTTIKEPNVRQNAFKTKEQSRHLAVVSTSSIEVSVLTDRLMLPKIKLKILTIHWIHHMYDSVSLSFRINHTVHIPLVNYLLFCHGIRYSKHNRTQQSITVLSDSKGYSIVIFTKSEHFSNEYCLLRTRITTNISFLVSLVLRSNFSFLLVFCVLPKRVNN